MQYKKILSHEEVNQHVAQSHELWGGSRSQEDRGNTLHALLKEFSSQLSMSGLIDENGMLTTSLKRYYYPLIWNNQEYLCLGLGAVFANPQFRKRGLTRQLIEQVLKDAKTDNGCHFAMLYSDIGAAYYRQFGFECLPSHYWEIDPKHVFQNNILQSRQADTSDFFKIAQWREEAMANSTLRTRHNANALLLYKTINGIKSGLIFQQGMRDVGYAMLSWSETSDYLWVDEMFCIEDAALMIWKTLAKMAIDQNKKILRGWHHPLIALPEITITDRNRALPMLVSLDKRLNVSASDKAQALFTSLDHF